MGIQHSQADWTGSLKEGKGTFSLPKANFTGQVTHASRFAEGDGTNPEELVGAALSSCFSMFLTALINKNGFESESVRTQAAVELVVGDNGPSITSISLTTEATATVDAETFDRLVIEAKENCPISKLCTGTTITVDAKLTSSVR